MLTELTTVFDSRQSFYHKAMVEDIKNDKRLYSYETPVCEIKNGKVKMLDLWDSSQTTVRHCKEFLKQNNFIAESKAQITKDYC